ncbi:thiosulfate sulfurtransferase [Pyrenophora seminiperda CCB06]|uniref:Thiosulfate sulfurtransferase n=1 Tax=Pyrenophora seminiperda CCB06 TaxID=1302712 RepID=A0A3M7MCV9_9PLEO|nr:thiosulfate sulfurtransferase [Pyrenophora seminiperda CCB06]
MARHTRDCDALRHAHLSTRPRAATTQRIAAHATKVVRCHHPTPGLPAMRRSTFPSRPGKPEMAVRAPEPPKRKVFNCIVDDTALIAGVKKSTRDGIRKWIAQDAIRLFVPLHTLTQLHRLKNGTERINADAREAVKWLDDVTSNQATSRVQLEGVDEAYTTWAQVEHFLLPETLLSMEDSESDDEEYHEDLESSFNALDMSDETSMSSTHSFEHVSKTSQLPHFRSSTYSKPADNPTTTMDESPSRTARNSNEIGRADKSTKSTVPVHFHSLFNHILWRINQEGNPDAALESFILLTNDPTKQTVAQKFGIRAKRLEQLRDAVAREDREYKNHLTMHKIEVEAIAAKTNGPVVPKTTERPKSSPVKEIKQEENSDDEDEVLFKRAPRGPAATTNNSQRIFDPNDFARTNQHQPARSGRGGHMTSRGRGGPSFRGRGNFAPRGAYVPPAPAFRAPPAPRHDPNAPLDPDSFSRPAPKVGPVRGGNRRKLWEPN